MPTEQAHRIVKARRLIRAAYGIDPAVDAARVIRYDLIGDSVAVVRLKDRTCADGLMTLRVAQELPSGRVKQLRKANRTGLHGYPDIIQHLQALHDAYGAASGAARTHETAKVHGGWQGRNARSGLRLPLAR
jgi:hypothetical protein